MPVFCTSSTSSGYSQTSDMSFDCETSDRDDGDDGSTDHAFRKQDKKRWNRSCYGAWSLSHATGPRFGTHVRPRPVVRFHVVGVPRSSCVGDKCAMAISTHVRMLKEYASASE